MPSTLAGSTSEKEVLLTKKEKMIDKAKLQEKKLKEYMVPKKEKIPYKEVNVQEKKLKEYIVPKKEKAPDTVAPRSELKVKQKVKPSN